jgi:hypothetical protein
MYEPGTILALKEQRPSDPETDEPFPYNQVKVIGPSPVSWQKDGEWSGASAAGVLLAPLTNFGTTLDEPYGKVMALYDVESVPVVEIEPPKVRVINSTSQSAGPTPEEVFAAKAPGVPPEQGRRRGRTTPLADPRPAKTDGPLGPVK